ncbi:MAG: glycoside hydrolase [Ferruginibacter sp.]
MLLFIAAIAFQMSCNKSSSGSSGGTTPTPTPTPTTPANTDVAFWASKADQTILLQKQADPLALGTASTTTQTITIDSTQTYQTVDGFGYTLTGGSATLINSLPAATKSSLLNELFGSDATSIGVSYLRVSLGASDLSATVYSYDDMPATQTDVNLNNFTLSLDTVDLIPLLKQIIAINPNIKILASPWSPPTWMKDNGSSIGGNLQTQYYGVYAKYFVKYIQAMKAKGITIDAVTLQNEPQNPANNPSMSMSATQEATFVKNNLGPEFQTAGLSTKIIVWDHNCDNANYPITVLGEEPSLMVVHFTYMQVISAH